ncbi:MAG: response regulator [Anaerolineaceae bacterium]|nr:MAG: response regulator [Anaerolineaceae bacterium]
MNKRNVLIVEDSPEVAEIIKVAFRRTELEIHHEANALNALTYLQSHKPDVIILDLGMPGMSGWEFLRNIRSQDHLSDIPVIILTAHTDHENRKTGRLLRVSAYLQKPIDLTALRNAIDDALYL